MIKVVLIDIDNTLLSFTGYVKEAMREGFSLFGLKPYTEAMFPVLKSINDSLWGQLEQGTLTFEELEKCRWDMIFKELEIDFDGMTFEEYFRKKLYYSAVPEDGAEDLLKYLSRKYTLCAASNGPYEQQINRLKIGKMDEYFTCCFICISVLRDTEYPDLVPEEVIVIGDSISSDISGGRDYGMHTCLYQKSGALERDDSGAEYVIRNLAEIKNIL